MTKPRMVWQPKINSVFARDFLCTAIDDAEIGANIYYENIKSFFRAKTQSNN